jgi:hypothetical protein
MAVVTGHAGGETIALERGASVPLSVLRKAHESWFPDYMNAPHTN